VYSFERYLNTSDLYSSVERDSDNTVVDKSQFFVSVSVGQVLAPEEVTAKDLIVAPAPVIVDQQSAVVDFGIRLIFDWLHRVRLEVLFDVFVRRCNAGKKEFVNFIEFQKFTFR